MDLNKPFSRNAPGHDQSPVVAVAIASPARSPLFLIGEIDDRGGSSSLSPPINTARIQLLRARANAAKCTNVQGGYALRFGACCAKGYRSARNAVTRLASRWTTAQQCALALLHKHRSDTDGAPADMREVYAA